MTKRVMIVDDAIFMRMILKDILENSGFEVVAEAQNGLEAIEKYKEEKPEIVIMDITMPELDGISALQQIRQFDPQARVIMCSAVGQQAKVMESIQSGAADFIVKPFDVERVLDSLLK